MKSTIFANSNTICEIISQLSITEKQIKNRLYEITSPSKKV